MIDLGLGPENNNLIEKMVSERTIKSKICNGFSPFFFVFLLFFNKHKQEAAVTGLNLACGRRWLISGLLGKQTLIEKLSERTLTFQTCIVFSPFFFVSPLGFNKHNQVAAMVWRNLAVEGDMIDCEFARNGLAVAGSASIQRQTVWRHPSWVPHGCVVS